MVLGLAVSKWGFFFQARKRKVSIHVAQGDNVRAISELNRYLKEFMNDGEAWMELCDLYVLEQVGSNLPVSIIRTSVVVKGCPGPPNFWNNNK